MAVRPEFNSPEIMEKISRWNTDDKELHEDVADWYTNYFVVYGSVSIVWTIPNCIRELLGVECSVCVIWCSLPLSNEAILHSSLFNAPTGQSIVYSGVCKTKNARWPIIVSNSMCLGSIWRWSLHPRSPSSPPYPHSAMVISSESLNSTISWK